MAKNVIFMLGLLLLAMVVLSPSKIAATRDYPEISSNSKAEISKSNDNEDEGSGEIGGVKLDIPPGCRVCCDYRNFCKICFCKIPPPAPSIATEQ
ncbi:uncharacterized protein LOC107486840 [Arachis duranensis]|uniref:Uncharacterized protein LOC107486840 n=1 Tax=Arachis duranensis TaxID=130453 RepID=A0A6P4D5X9_ARADU|nr:uncharacterized protein LOC107486840 [Arachis duranensis]